MVGCNDDTHAMTNTELTYIINKIEQQSELAKKHYKPIRVFVVNDWNFHFGAIIAAVAKRNKYINCDVNAVGKTKWSDEPDAKARAEKFTRRMSYYLSYFHPKSRPLEEISGGEMIDIADII